MAEPNHLPQPTAHRRPARRLILASVLAAVAAAAVLLLVVRGGDGILDPPPPERLPDGDWVPDLPPSTLNVPIRYDLTPVIQALEAAVPRSYGSLDDRLPIADNERTHFAFVVHRDAFLTSLLDDWARISTVLSYRARAWYDAPVLPEVRSTCGTSEEPLRAVVSISARIWLSESWGLKSDARVDHIAPLSETDRDRCRLTPLRIDVTERVMVSAREALEEHLPELQRALSRVDVRSRFERWWETLARPIRLSDDVWLVIDPIGVHRGQTRGTGHTLVANVGLAARPRIVLGAEPAYRLPPLPSLEEPMEGEGLHIRATGTADYETASARLTEALEGREITQGSQSIVLDRAQVSGVGSGRLALDIYFSGSANGHVYLVGTPQYDPATGQVHIPDLSLSVESANLLLQGYTWLAEEEILAFFREGARWKVDDLAHFAREQLLSGLNRSLNDEVHLQGEVGTVEILGVYPLSSSLIVQAEAVANVTLIISEVTEGA